MFVAVVKNVTEHRVDLRDFQGWSYSANPDGFSLKVGELVTVEEVDGDFIVNILDKWEGGD